MYIFVAFWGPMTFFGQCEMKLISLNGCAVSNYFAHIVSAERARRLIAETWINVCVLAKNGWGLLSIADLLASALQALALSSSAHCLG